MTMRHSVTAVALALGLAALAACDMKDDAGRPTTTTPPRASDQHFVTAAAQANLAEVEAGRLAESKSDRPDIKEFARRMVEDHGNANSELKDLAEKKGLLFPTETDAAHKEDAAKLADLTGPEFDKKYAAMMVKDHEKAVALFQEHSKSARDADIRTFAEKTLPTLQDHLKMARDLSDKVGAPTAD